MKKGLGFGRGIISQYFGEINVSHESDGYLISAIRLTVKICCSEIDNPSERGVFTT
jgi:hypothetical protein